MQSLSRQEIIVLVVTGAFCMFALHRLQDAYPGMFPVIWGPRLLTELLLAGGVGIAVYAFTLGLIR